MIIKILCATVIGLVFIANNCIAMVDDFPNKRRMEAPPPVQAAPTGTSTADVVANKDAVQGVIAANPAAPSPDASQSATPTQAPAAPQAPGPQAPTTQTPTPQASAAPQAPQAPTQPPPQAPTPTAPPTPTSQASAAVAPPPASTPTTPALTYSNPALAVAAALQVPTIALSSDEWDLPTMALLLSDTPADQSSYSSAVASSTLAAAMAAAPNPALVPWELPPAGGTTIDGILLPGVISANQVFGKISGEAWKSILNEVFRGDNTLIDFGITDRQALNLGIVQILNIVKTNLDSFRNNPQALEELEKREKEALHMLTRLVGAMVRYDGMTFQLRQDSGSWCGNCVARTILYVLIAKQSLGINLRFVTVDQGRDLHAVAAYVGPSSNKVFRVELGRVFQPADIALDRLKGPNEAVGWIIGWILQSDMNAVSRTIVSYKRERGEVMPRNVFNRLKERLRRCRVDAERALSLSGISSDVLDTLSERRDRTTLLQHMLSTAPVAQP